VCHAGRRSLRDLYTFWVTLPLVSVRYLQNDLVEKDGYVVGGELGLFACADCDFGCGVSAGGDGMEQSVGQKSGIGAVPLDDESWIACGAALHGASLMGVGVGCGGGYAVLEQNLRDAFFERVEGLNGRRAGEVFDGVEEAAIFEDGDANGIEVGVEDVGAVGGAGHPASVELGRTDVSSCEVFGDGCEVSVCLGGARGEVGFAGVLMLEVVGFVDDPLGMGERGLSEGWVPVEWREVVLGACLIGHLEEGTFGV
jgi:hypothetical protein